jgi:hypothetical protein
MAARVLEVADVLVARIRELLDAAAPGSTITREYVPEVSDESFDTWIDNLTELAVYVIPIRKAGSLQSRNKDNEDYTFSVIFIQKFTDAGRPTKEWMDDRVTIVAGIEDDIGDIRNPISGLWAEESEVSLIFDPGMYDANHAFWSVMTITLREVA